jgi:Ohr subfamily peroxiredoxin
MAIDTALYTARASATGGRAGSARSDDGRLAVTLSTPKALGGDDGTGTNPEQMFAAGYAACFIGALKAVAGRRNLRMPGDVRIDAEVGIGPMSGKPGAFGIAVTMKVSVPDMDRATVEELVAAAHEVCPYSNATRGNVDVTLRVAD